MDPSTEGAAHTRTAPGAVLSFRDSPRPPTEPVLRNILKTLVTPPAKERPGDWTQHPDYFVGKEALANDDAASAREAFSRVLAERPQQLDARAGLARAGFALGDPSALTLVDQVLDAALAGTTELLRVTLEELGPAAAALALRPITAWRVAQRLDADGDRDGARPYYEVASRSDGLVGLKARVRALELDPEPTVPLLSAAADLTAREPELQKRVTALLRKFVPQTPRSIELPPDDTVLEFEVSGSIQQEHRPVVIPARLEGRVDGGLVVATRDGVATLPWRKILGLAAGVVPAPDGRSAVLTDLVTAWADGEKGATVLRAGLGDLGLDRLYPGLPLKEAYFRLLGDIAQASAATRLPPGAEGAALPRFAGPEEMTRACHCKP